MYIDLVPENLKLSNLLFSTSMHCALAGEPSITGDNHPP